MKIDKRIWTVLGAVALALVALVFVLSACEQPIPEAQASKAAYLFAYDGSAWQKTTMNEDSQALIIIDHAADAVLDGDAFEASGARDVTSGETFDILIVTADSTVHANLMLGVDTEGEASYTLHEAVTATNGTELASYSRNRTSAEVAITNVYTTASVANAGTTIRTRHWGDEWSGALQREGWFTVLEANTKYLWRITEASAAANYIGWVIKWHEH